MQNPLTFLNLLQFACPSKHEMQLHLLFCQFSRS